MNPEYQRTSRNPLQLLGRPKKCLTYKELREVVQSGMLTQKQFEDWQQDYSVLVEKKMAGVWMSAMAVGVAGQPDV